MKKRWIRIIGIIAVILLLIDVLSYFADEPVRRYVEREMNSRLKGYSVEIKTLSIHQFAFSVDLENIILRQKANPEPAIAEIRRIRGSVRWRYLFTGHVVGDAEIDNPKLYINIKNLTAEIKKPPSQKEAWQDTIEAIFPLKINEFRIKNGEATYVESAQSKPVKIAGVTFVAHNIKKCKIARKGLSVSGFPQGCFARFSKNPGKRRRGFSSQTIPRDQGGFPPGRHGSGRVSGKNETVRS